MDLKTDLTERNREARSEIEAGHHDQIAPEALLRRAAARMVASSSPTAAALVKFHGAPSAGGALQQRAAHATERLVNAASTAIADAALVAPVPVPPKSLTAALAKETIAATSDRSIAGLARHIDSQASRAARAAIAGMIASIRARRERLAPLAKFVTNGAKVVTFGGPRGSAPAQMSLARSLVALGVIGSFSFTLIPNEVVAGERTRRVLAIIGGMAAGAAAPQVYQRLRSNNGYAQQPLYQNQGYGGPQLNYRHPGYGGYQDYRAAPVYDHPRREYRRPYYQPNSYAARPIPMSDEMTIAAKAVVAAEVNSITQADAIIDQAIRQGMSCMNQMGYGGNCVVRAGSVTMDFARGRFVAAPLGRVVAREENGIYSADDMVMRQVWNRAKALKVQEDDYRYGAGGYGPRF